MLPQLIIVFIYSIGNIDCGAKRQVAVFNDGIFPEGTREHGANRQVAAINNIVSGARLFRTACCHGQVFGSEH